MSGQLVPQIMTFHIRKTALVLILTGGGTLHSLKFLTKVLNRINLLTGSLPMLKGKRRWCHSKVGHMIESGFLKSITNQSHLIKLNLTSCLGYDNNLYFEFLLIFPTDGNRKIEMEQWTLLEELEAIWFEDKMRRSHSRWFFQVLKVR